ncbi:hypothetical protein BGZ73_004485 [Actinomortierella ambigua]|nr:hypothetical protein BGZ73_004485 [Actinomortierella ambigua]
MKITTVESLPVQYVSHDTNVEKRVFLKKGEVPHLSQFATCTFKPGEQATVHHHDDMTETFHFIAGTAEVEVDGKIHIATPGTTVTVFPKESHEIRNNGTEDVIMVYFGVIN